MPTPKALGILTTLIAQKQNEIDSLTLALSVLETTFAPDLTAIKAAQADADTQRALVADLSSQVTTLTATADAAMTMTTTQTMPSDGLPTQA